MTTLTEDQKKASEVKTVVVKEEAIANKKAEETKIIADDAQRDLDQALPALKAANKVQYRITFCVAKLIHRNDKDHAGQVVVLEKCNKECSSVI